MVVQGHRLLQQMDNNSRRLACWKRVSASFLRCGRDYDQIRDDSHKLPWETGRRTKQDEELGSAIRNSGRLDTVSFCGVLVHRPRESKERPLRETREPHAVNALTLCNCNPSATIELWYEGRAMPTEISSAVRETRREERFFYLSIFRTLVHLT